MQTLVDAKVVCVTDHDGNVLIGAPPKQDPPSWCVLSGDFLSYALRSGEKRRK